MKTKTDSNTVGQFKSDIAMSVKGLFKGIGQFFRYLFLTPAGGSKRRAEQQAYEDRLDEDMKCVKADDSSEMADQSTND